MMIGNVLIAHVSGRNPAGSPQVLRVANQSLELLVDGVPTPYRPVLMTRGWSVAESGLGDDGYLWPGGVVAPTAQQLRLRNRDGSLDELFDWDFGDGTIELLRAAGRPPELTLEDFALFWSGTVAGIDVDDTVRLNPRPPPAILETDLHGPEETFAGLGGKLGVPAGGKVRIPYDASLQLGEQFTIQIALAGPSPAAGTWYDVAKHPGIAPSYLTPWFVFRDAASRWAIKMKVDAGGGQYTDVTYRSTPVGEQRGWITWVVDRAAGVTVWTERSWQWFAGALGAAPPTTADLELKNGGSYVPEATEWTAFRLFSQALDADQVAATVGKPISAADWPLILEYTFGDRMGFSLTDVSGNQRHAVIEGFDPDDEGAAGGWGSTWEGDPDRHATPKPVALGRIYGAPAPLVDPVFEGCHLHPTAVARVQRVRVAGIALAPTASEEQDFRFTEDGSVAAFWYPFPPGEPSVRSVLDRWVAGGRLEVGGPPHPNLGPVTVVGVNPPVHAVDRPHGGLELMTDASGWTAGTYYASLTGLYPGWVPATASPATIRLMSEPGGVITVDLVGDDRLATGPAPAWVIEPRVEQLGNLAAQLVTLYGARLGADRFAVPDYDALPAAGGLWLDEPTSVLAELERVLRSGLAWLLVDAEGRMWVEPFRTAAEIPGDPVRTLGPRDVRSVHRVNRKPRPGRIEVLYGHNHRPLVGDELAAGVPDAERDFLATEWRRVRVPAGAGPRQGVPTPAVETVLALERDARALGDRVWQLTRDAVLYRLELVPYRPEYDDELTVGAKVRIDPDRDPVCPRRRLRHITQPIDVVVVGRERWPEDGKFEPLVLWMPEG